MPQARSLGKGGARRVPARRKPPMVSDGTSPPLSQTRRRRGTPGMSDGECQEAIFAFLADPATHGGRAVKRIDTHAASVFLVGERALKVKRAVRFPFLDYSTVARRKSACEAELQINRSFAPGIYPRVLAITREPDLRPPLDATPTPLDTP